MIHVALLIAIEIVLSRFCSISTPILRIGFGFVPVAVCGMLYGPVWAGVAAGIADVIGTMLFSGGMWFPGITLSSILTGVVFGLFLYRRQAGWTHIFVAAFINCFVISLLVTTLWLHILFGTPYWTLLLTRILQNCIMLPIQFMIMRLLQKPIFLYSSKRLSA